MHKKQWYISAVLFLSSLGFLYYSHYLFPSRRLAEQVVTALPSAPTPQTEIVVLANKDYYPFLKQHFAGAKESIRGTIFLFKAANYRDNEPADLLRELIAAAKRNVEVDLVMEMSSEVREYNEANKEAAEALRKAGAKVRLDHEKITTHAKVFVIDGHYCFVGSHNFTHAAMAMNQELSLFVDSPELGARIDQFLAEIPLSPRQ